MSSTTQPTAPPNTSAYHQCPQCPIAYATLWHPPFMHAGARVRNTGANARTDTRTHMHTIRALCMCAHHSEGGYLKRKDVLCDLLTSQDLTRLLLKFVHGGLPCSAGCLCANTPPDDPPPSLDHQPGLPLLENETQTRAASPQRNAAALTHRYQGLMHRTPQFHLGTRQGSSAPPPPPQPP
jgi:hypothetical protein